jgi:hypothetical protein
MNNKHKNAIWTFAVLAIVALVFITATEKHFISAPLDLKDFEKEEISAKKLTEWNFQGLGKAFEAGSGQFCLKENDSTFGVVLISPKYYKNDIVVRYKTMTLTSASVLVAMLAASDVENTKTLTTPEDYNGNMGLWVNNKNNYFFAFRNEPHNFTPFIRKYPKPGGDALASTEKNVMIPGKYYSIEIGKVENKLWLTIDGEKIVEATDNEILEGGHFIFRIRGTAGLKAACLIKDLEIYSK